MERILKAKEEESVRAFLAERNRLLMDACGDTADQSHPQETRERSVYSLERAAEMLRMVREAQRRLVNGAFGLCRNCHGRIAPRRLLTEPWIPLCSNCRKSPEGHLDGFPAERHAA